jgi:RNA polymerase sigma factor for flagellar operon FliA
VTIDDLRSFGHEGLMRAAQTYDTKRGVPLRRWANRCIRLAIAEGLRRWANRPRSRSKAEKPTPGLDAPSTSAGRTDAHEIERAREEASDKHPAGRLTPSDPPPTPEDLAERRELAALVHACVAALDPIERAVMERHDLGEETLDQIARDLQVSRSWACRVRKRALRKLQRALVRELRPKLARPARAAADR